MYISFSDKPVQLISYWGSLEKNADSLPQLDECMIMSANISDEICEFLEDSESLM